MTAKKTPKCKCPCKCCTPLKAGQEQREGECRSCDMGTCGRGRERVTLKAPGKTSKEGMAPKKASGPAELTMTEKYALHELGQRLGRLWKARLRSAWTTGRYDLIPLDADDIETLRELQKKLGPNGVDRL